MPGLRGVTDTKPQEPKHRDATLSSLNAAIEAAGSAEASSTVAPAKAVFSSVSIILTIIRVRSLLFSSDVFLVYIRPELYGRRN